MILIGVLAQQTRSDIEWDAETMGVRGRRELDDLVREPARRGWRLGDAAWRG
jgi:hypothetical protein